MVLLLISSYEAAGIILWQTHRSQPKDDCQVINFEKVNSPVE